jgi:hypothetical protein
MLHPKLLPVLNFSSSCHFLELSSRESLLFCNLPERGGLWITKSLVSCVGKANPNETIELYSIRMELGSGWLRLPKKRIVPTDDHSIHSSRKRVECIVM